MGRVSTLGGGGGTVLDIGEGRVGHKRREGFAL